MVISHSEALCGSLTALRLANGSSGDEHVVKMSKTCSPAWSDGWHNMSKSFLSQIKKWGVNCRWTGTACLRKHSFLSSEGNWAAVLPTNCRVHQTSAALRVPPLKLVVFYEPLISGPRARLCFYRPITPLATWRVQQDGTFKRVNIPQ